MNNLLKFSPIVILLFVIMVLPAFAQTTEHIQISLNYPNGDRVELSDAKIIIFKDNTQIAELIGTAKMQYFEIDLPDYAHYKTEVFINEIFSGHQVFSVTNSQDLHVTVPSSTGVQFNVFYNDGQTPIENATIMLKTKSGTEVTHGNTDMDGKALRFWIPSIVNSDDYYVPEIHLGDKLVFYPDVIRPISGSSDIIVKTSWPKSIQSIPITVYADDFRKLGNFDGEFYVTLYSGVKKIVESKLNHGEVKFSNIPVGEYRLTISKTTSSGIVELQAEQVVLEKNDYPVKVVLVQNTQPKELTPPPVSLNFNTLEDFQKTHQWKKQSSSGIQVDDPYHFVFGDQSIKIMTDGDSKPVFSRSPKYTSLDLSEKIIVVRLKIDDSTYLKELSFAFTDDDVKSNWFVYQIPPSTIHSGQWQDVEIDLSNANIIGTPNIKSINKIQARITDNYQKAVMYLNGISVYNKGEISKPTNNCNCIAFRLDDIQDFWLDDVQVRILETLRNHNIPVTVGIIGDTFGSDQKIVNAIKEGTLDSNTLEIANHGWKHEDFTKLDQSMQTTLLQQTNKRISEILLVRPTVFIPPMNLYNNSTMQALQSVGFKYISSELDKSSPPYPFNGQTIYQFPETAVTGNLNSNGTSFLKIDSDETFSQIDYSIKKYGFAVVTLHPQEFSEIIDGKYTNEPDETKFQNFESLIQKIKSSGKNTVFVSKINQSSNTLEIPSWVKNSGKWWYEGKISGNEFVKSIEYLIKQDIIIIPKSHGETMHSSEIPEWIKTNTYWWSQGKISDSEFVSSIQYLINKEIIQI